MESVKEASSGRAGRIGLALFLLSTTAGAQDNGSASVPVTWFGEVRARSEWESPGGGARSDQFTLLRTRLGIRAEASDAVRVTIQLQDSRLYGIAAGGAGSPTSTGLHQGFAEVSGAVGALDLTARVGRQEMAIANERLVGVVNWSNTGRVFDGARLILAPTTSGGDPEPWSATAFAATVDERGRRSASAGTDGDRTMAGLSLTRNLGAATAEGTLLFDQGAAYQRLRASNRVTMHGRLRSTGSGIGYDVELARQAGRQQYTVSDISPAVRQDVGAWMAGARIGRLAGSAPGEAAFLGVDVLSGDADPSDGSFRAFHTMYASNHSFYGLMDLLPNASAAGSDLGLVDAFAVMTGMLTPRATARLELHRFTPHRGSAGTIGWEADLIVPFAIAPGASLDAGYGWFRAGPGAPIMGLGADGVTRHWAFVSLRADF